MVVATYNRRTQLRNLLDSLFAQDLPPTDMEIVVVVDGSSDGTTDMLRELQPACRIRIVEQANAGQAAARNAGLRVAAAPIVLFLDDDLECPPNLLSEHLALHDRGPGQVVVGRIESRLAGRRSLSHEKLESQLQGWERRMEDQPGMRWPEDAYAATNCSIDRRLLEQVGGFDPAFYRALEDHDLGLRLWSEGGRFVYAPGAVVRQHYSKTTRDVIREERWYGRAEVRLGRKHPECLQHTLLARAAAQSWWRRRLLRLFATFPIAARVLLGIPLELFERLAPAAPIGQRLLAAWMQAVRMRAAVDALGGWPNFDEVFSRRLAVLMYHHVGPARSGTYPDLTVSPEAFTRQIASLARHGYKAISPQEYLRARRGEAPLPKRAVMLTFDDGYADIAEHALPVLERFGFGSAVFIVTGEIGGTNSWDEARGSGTHRLLTREQIITWQAKGVEFGAHTRVHASLPSLETRELPEEIAGSGDDLERLTGCPPVAFAYPYGEYDERALEVARSACQLAFTTEEGLNWLATDPHRLRRTMAMPDDTGWDTLLRVRLGYNPWEILLRWRAAAVRPVRRALAMLRRSPPRPA